MKRLFSTLLLLITMISACRVALGDITYDATSQYSSLNNANGVWTYGWKLESSLGNSNINVFNANLNASGAHADFNYWRDSTLNVIPLVGKYQSNTDSGEQDGTVFLANQVALHAGNAVAGVAAAVVRFTAPETASYHLDQAIFEYRSNIPGNKVYLYWNGSNLFEGTLGARGSQVSPGQMTLNLSAGDHLDFIVGSRGGATNSTTTQLNARLTQLSSVPEPSSLALFTIVGAVCGLFRTRKRSSLTWSSRCD